MSLYFKDTEIPFLMDNVMFYADNFCYGPITVPIPGHTHGTGSYEIHYISQGYGNLVLPGKTCEVIPGTLFVTGPQVHHAQVPLKENPMTEYCIYLRVGSISSLPGYRKRSSGILSSFLSTAFWFGTGQENIHHLFQELFMELEKQCIGYLCQAESLIRQIIVYIARNYVHERGMENTLGNYKKISNPSLMLEEAFLTEYNSLTLESLASRLGLSTRQTQRFLKEQYGQTFIQKRTQARMSAAICFLADKSISLTEIAGITGYSSVEHFSETFHKFYGISAREYRKRHK